MFRASTCRRQRAVDWNAVKAAGAEFGYVVATEGGKRDARFEENWRGAANAEVRRGAIHAWSLCRPPPIRRTISTRWCPEPTTRYPGAVDRFRRRLQHQADRDAVLDELRRFIAIIEAHTERPVILLVSRAVEARYRVTEAIERPVWSAGISCPRLCRAAMADVASERYASDRRHKRVGKLGLVAK